MILPSRHFSPFKLFLAREERLALMLNPKVLTTFTRRLLADGYHDFRGRTDPSDNRYRLFAVPRRFPVAPVRDYVDFFRRPEAYDLHAFVRNPYRRLASAWRNKFYDGHRKSPDGRDSAYSRSIRWHHIRPIRRFARASGLPGGHKGELVPFETFLRYAAARPEGKRDHHWDTQSAVLMCDRLTYARVFRIEDQLEEGFLAFGGRLGFSEDWVRERLKKPANPSKTSAPLYDARLAELARPLCGDDFARFGYSEDSWQGV